MDCAILLFQKQRRVQLPSASHLPKCEVAVQFLEQYMIHVMPGDTAGDTAAPAPGAFAAEARAR